MLEFGLTPEEREVLGEQQRKRDLELIKVRSRVQQWAPRLFTSEYMQVYLVLYFEVVVRKLYTRGGQGGVEVEQLDVDGVPAIKLAVINETLSLREVYAIIERERGQYGNVSLPKALSFMDHVDLNPLANGGVRVEVLKKGMTRVG